MVTREEFVECPSCSCTDTSYEVIEEKDSAFREPVYSLGSSDPVAIVSDRTSSFKIDDNLFFAGVEYKTYVDVNYSIQFRMLCLTKVFKIQHMKVCLLY